MDAERGKLLGEAEHILGHSEETGVVVLVRDWRPPIGGVWRVNVTASCSSFRLFPRRVTRLPTEKGNLPAFERFDASRFHRGAFHPHDLVDCRVVGRAKGALGGKELSE